MGNDGRGYTDKGGGMRMVPCTAYCPGIRGIQQRGRGRPMIPGDHGRTG